MQLSKPQYVETLLNFRQCIHKGYLSYVPNDLLATSWQQNPNYRVVNLQNTYIVYSLKGA